MSGFLPQGYAPPKSTSGNYMKFGEEGSYIFRILKSPIFGTEYWSGDGQNRKPVRLREGIAVDPSKLGLDQNGKQERARHFWSMPVLDYSDGRVKILNLSQVTIQRQITGFNDNPRWGDPRKYDIEVVRRDGQKVEYQVIAHPPSKLPDDLRTNCIEMLRYINMEALYDGGDPMAAVPASLQASQAVTAPESAAPQPDHTPIPDDDIPF